MTKLTTTEIVKEIDGVLKYYSPDDKWGAIYRTIQIQLLASKKMAKALQRNKDKSAFTSYEEEALTAAKKAGII